MINNRSIGTLLKSLPATFKAAGDNELWALATVEVPDRELDVVRVKGISLEYHEKSPLKIMGLGHKYGTTPDGSPQITGFVKEFVHTTTSVKGTEVPALAFRMEFDLGEDGNPTPYAAKMKSLFQKGKLDSFSIGFESREMKPLPKGRYDFLKSAVFEISPCVIPTNPYATVLKSLQDEGIDVDALQLLEERMIQMQQATDARLADIAATITKAFQTRFDDYESAAAARAVKPLESSPADSVQQPTYESILAQLNAIAAKK